MALTSAEKEKKQEELNLKNKLYEQAKAKGDRRAMAAYRAEADAIKQELKPESQAEAELNGWGMVYNAAKRQGDVSGMEKAHEEANKIRRGQGWEYDSKTGKTYDTIFGPFKRTVNSRSVMENAKIWDVKDLKPITPTPRRTVTTPASSYLRGTINTPSVSYAAARQNDPVYSAALDLTTGKYESTGAQDFAKSFAYGTEKTLAGAAGAVEDALRFASGYGNKLLSGITSLGGLADNPVSDFLAQTAENTLSGSYVDRWRQSIDERYQPTEFQQKLGGLNEAAGAMLPSIAASIASGGLSNAAAIGKGASMTAAGAQAAQDISRGIGLATMFPQVAGASTRQAIQEGANVDSALAYGALSGGLETATESLFAGIPGIAGGRVSQAVQNIIAKATKIPAVSKAADILGEGVEEVISGYVTPYLQRLTYNEQAELASNDELLENFISGVALSGIMQGGSGIAGRIANRSAGQGIDVNSLGENSRKNYIAQTGDGYWISPQFDEQWKQYNDAGKAGIPYEQVPGSPDIIGESRAYAAHAAGMNDYNARQSSQATVTQKTAKSEEPKETVVSLSTVDESGIPETTFSDSSARALSKIQDVAKRTGRSEQEVAKSLLQTYENQYQNAINAATEYIKGYQPQGVSVIGRDSTTGQGGYRVSNNEKWYSDFYQKNGRNPNSSDIPALAEQLVKEDRSGTMFGFSADSMNTLEDYREIVNNVLNRKGFSRIEKTDDGYQAVYNESQTKETTTPTTYTPGLVQNDYTASVSESTAKSIDSIAKKVGVSVEISDNVSASGEYRDGVIRINANSDNPVQQIFVHELTHHLEQSKGYSDLVSVIEKNLTAGGIDSQVLRDNIKTEYAERGVQLDDDGANRELVAKYAEEFLFTDEASIQRLANQNRSLAQRIKDWIHGMVVKFKGTRQEKALLEAEKKYIKALKNTTGARKTGKTQYSISGSDYGLFKTNDPKIDSEKENLSYQDASILLDNQIGLYYRSSEKTDGMSDFGHAMFVDKNGLENLSSYRGEQIFSVSENDLYDINDLKDSILSARNKTQEESFDLDDFADLSDEEFFAMFNPSDIVDSAGAYDNDVLISWLYDNVLEPNGITGVKTDDGAVVYDPEIIYRNIPAEKYMYSSPEYSTGSSFDKLLRDAGYAQEADALQKAAKKYGTIQPPARSVRDVQIPKQVSEGSKVSKFSRTVAESQIASDELITELTRGVASGEYNYEPVTNRGDIEQALQEIENDSESAERRFNMAMGDEKRITSKDVALGIELIAKAERDGDAYKANQIAADLAVALSEAGQAIQAASIMTRLDKTGQLMTLNSTANRIQRNIDKTNEAQPKKAARTKKKNVKAAGRSAKRDATDSIKKGRNMASKELSRLENIPVENWLTETGNLLAKRIGSRFEVNAPKQKTTMQTILSDLTKFAREHIDMKSNGQTKGMSAVDTLRNYFANKDEYTTAWNSARGQLREQYKNDPEKLDALESFLQATIDYNGDPLHNQAVILSAILSTVDSNGELIDRASVIGSASISEQIANKLIAETGVSGTNAVILREAVSRNLSDYLIEKTSPTKLKSLIQKAAKENGTKLKELATATPKRRSEIYQQIRNTLVSKYAATAEEAAAAERILTSEYQNLVRKYSESAIKARFKERMVSPRKDFWDVYREYAAMGVFDSEYAAKASEKLFGSDKIKVDDALAQRLLNAETPEEIVAATEAIKDDIAAQIPGTWEDKIASWPYISMLTNFRTLFLRMPIGNLAFQPLKITKDIIAGALEPIFLKPGNRTKSLSGALPLTGGEYRDFAIADYKKMEKILKSGGKMNPMDDISARKRIFKSLPLEAVRKFSQYIMDKGDTSFLSSGYVRAMVQYAKANKLTVEQLQGDQLDKAREIAMSEALKVTFRDYSQAAVAINNLERNLHPIARVAVKGLSPFVKTPINIGKRGIEYSPTGLLRTVGKVYDMLRNGNATGADVIDSLAASLSGSAFLVLGVLLSRAGMLKAGGDDDKESQFLDSLGFQSYAFKVGDTSYTIDWLSPAAIPLFLGAEIQPYLDGGTLGVAEAQEAGFRILDVMTETSYMSSLNEALQAVKYGGDGNDLSKIFNAALSSYILQFLPSAISQLAQVADPYRRTKYTDPNSELPGLVQEIQQGAMKKIPGLSQKLPPYVDMWGRTQKEENAFKRIFNQISPGFIKEETLNEVEQELIRLSGNGYTAFPGKFESSFDYDGGTYEMDAEEYTKYKVKVGATQYAIINNLLSNPGYALLDDSEKKDVISKVYSFAKVLGRKEIMPDYPVQSSDQKMIDAYNIGIKYDDYLIIKQDVSSLEGFTDEETGNTVRNSPSVVKANYLITETSLTPSQRSYMYDVLNVGKTVQEYSPEKVKSEYQKMYNEYGR